MLAIQVAENEEEEIFSYSVTRSVRISEASLSRDFALQLICN
jgi:hypothetical protein